MDIPQWDWQNDEPNKKKPPFNPEDFTDDAKMANVYKILASVLSYNELGNLVLGEDHFIRSPWNVPEDPIDDVDTLTADWNQEAKDDLKNFFERLTNLNIGSDGEIDLSNLFDSENLDEDQNSEGDSEQ